jgi:pyruvate dehydrogenase E1 component
MPYITSRLMDSSAVTVAVSDYMRAVPDQIARWVPGPWQSLGADGFGFADTRAAARRVFQIDAESIVVSVLQTLAQRGSVPPEKAREAFARFRIDDPTAVADVEQVGGDA